MKKTRGELSGSGLYQVKRTNSCKWLKTISYLIETMTNHRPIFQMRGSLIKDGRVVTQAGLGGVVVIYNWWVKGLSFNKGQIRFWEW